MRLISKIVVAAALVTTAIIIGGVTILHEVVPGITIPDYDGNIGFIFFLIGFSLAGIVGGTLAPLLTPYRIEKTMSWSNWSRGLSPAVFFGILIGFPAIPVIIGIVFPIENDPGTTFADVLTQLLIAGFFGGVVAALSLPVGISLGQRLRGREDGILTRIGDREFLTNSVGGENIVRSVKKGRFHIPNVFDHVDSADSEKYELSVETWVASAQSESRRVASSTPVDEVDDELDIPFKFDVDGPHYTTVKPFSTDTHRQIVDVATEDCAQCNGDEKYCTRCSDSGRVSCGKCSGKGVIEYECGCAETERHRGARTVTASSGEILRTCQTCGGDGKYYIGNDRQWCESCNSQGAIADTCPSCGGDAVSNTETCPKCAGSKSVQCSSCEGQSDVPDCPQCDGTGSEHVVTLERFDYSIEHRLYGKQTGPDVKWALGSRFGTESFSFDGCPSPSTVVDSVDQDDFARSSSDLDGYAGRAPDAEYWSDAPDRTTAVDVTKEDGLEGELGQSFGHDAPGADPEIPSTTALKTRISVTHGRVVVDTFECNASFAEDAQRGKFAPITGDGRTDRTPDDGRLGRIHTITTHGSNLLLNDIPKMKLVRRDGLVFLTGVFIASYIGFTFGLAVITRSVGLLTGTSLILIERYLPIFLAIAAVVLVRGTYEISEYGEIGDIDL